MAAPEEVADCLPWPLESEERECVEGLFSAEEAREDSAEEKDSTSGDELETSDSLAKAGLDCLGRMTGSEMLAMLSKAAAAAR